jgi:hypothetical protein
MKTTLRMARHALLVLAVASLAACASRDQKSVTDAATAPLSDLNLLKAEIPAPLIKAQQGPYAVPVTSDCPGLNAELQALNEVLGPDYDAPPGAEESLLDKGTAEAKKAAVGALRNTTEGIVPFRGWVRKLSGAERHSRKVQAAISAGTARRAFLKGMRLQMACPAVQDASLVPEVAPRP